MIRPLWMLLVLLSLAGCAGLSSGKDGQAPSASIDGGALLAAADATRADGRLTEAVQIYQQVLLGDPGSAPAQYGMAESLLGLGRAADAKPLFVGLAKQAALRAAALQGAGIADLALRKYQDAAGWLREAVAADAKLWRAYNGLGLIADVKRQPEEAVAFYNQALAVHPESAVVLNNRGYSQLVAGKSDEAIADFRSALRLEPASETIQNNLRLALATKGNYADATRSLPQPQQSIVLNNIGFVAMRRGDLAAAEGFLSRAMTANAQYEAVTARNLQQLTALKAGSK